MNRYLNNFVGYFADSRGGWTFSTGQLSVLSPVVAGVYAYSSQSSFVNTFALNGASSTDTMSVKCTYNTGRSYSAYLDTTVQPASCSSANSAVATSSSTTSGCLVTLTQSGGSSSVSINASYGGFSAAVAYRLYYFLQYSLNATRVGLRRLGCDFESSYLSAFGTVTLDGVTALATIDLSNTVTFSSSNASVLSVSGRVAKGVSVGACSVSYGGGAASQSISVSSAVATVQQLVSYAYSSVVVSPISVASVSEMASTTVQVQPALSLTAEGATASLVTYAQNDDGVWTDVSQYSTLSLSSVSPADLNVTKSGANWQLVVPVGASTVSGGTPVIGGVLRDSCATVLSSAGYGYAKTNLSVPIAIVVTASASPIARPSTPAASVLGVVTSTQLTVTVTFRSATGVLSYVAFTTDPRTVYTANFTNAAGSVSASGLVSLSSSSGVGTAGSVSVVVSMPSYSAAAGLSGILNVPIVDVNTAVALTGSLVHTMTTSVAVSASTPLAPLACTGVYQGGSLSTVTVTLTDGSTQSGTPSLSSNNTLVATVFGTSVTPVTPGVASIIASFASAVGLFNVYVNSSSVSIATISLSFSSSTLSGQMGTSSAGSVAVFFSDGTFFANAVTSFSPLASLLGFRSSDPASISISSTGVVALVNNSWQQVILSAFSQCADSRNGTYLMAGNLLPAIYDTKLGFTTGLMFPPTSYGGSLDASIRVQVASFPLVSYQMWLFYNSSVFGAPTISKGSGWSVGSFSFSVGNFVSGTIYKAILSFSSGSSATSTLVPMATVSFPVIASWPVLELITANVLTYTDSSGTIFQSGTGTQIVAGTGYVSLNSGFVPQFRRRNLLTKSPTPSPVTVVHMFVEFFIACIQCYYFFHHYFR